MKAADLAAEFYAAFENVHGGIAERMRFLGIPVDEDRPRVGVARVVTREDGTFEPHPDGALHLIIAEGIPEPNLGWREIVDLIALRTDDPTQWWLRRDIVDLLGSDEIDRAAFAGLPLVLLPSPLDWLRAGCVGAVIVNWSLDPRSIFGAVDTVHCTTEALRHRLRKRLEEVCKPRLRILADGEARRDAA